MTVYTEVPDPSPKDFRLQRIKHLLSELALEIGLGLDRDELDPDLTYDKKIPRSRFPSDGVVQLHVSVHPVAFLEMVRNDPLTAHLAIGDNARTGAG